MKTFNGNKDGSFGQKPTQLLLWDSPPIDPTQRLKTAMREALNGCSLSRTKVIADMNALAGEENLTCGGRGQRITEDILEKWVAPSAVNHVIPLKYIALFCKVTQSLLPLQAIAGCVGAEIIAGEDKAILQWAKVEIERRRLTKTAGKLAQEVGLK